MRRTNLLILATLFACLGAWGQNLISVRVGLTIEGARFLVDGQEFRSTQNFVWPENSKHTIQFRFNLDAEGGPTGYQYADNHVARYSFGGWTISGTTISPASNRIITVQATPDVTSIIGGVTIEHRMVLEFSDPPPMGTCSGGPADPLQDVTRRGIVYIDGECFDTDTDELWLVAGPHIFEGFAYPGWLFSGWIINGNIPPDPFVTTFEVNDTATIRPQFSRAKRVHFRTNPLGLKMIVDRSIITPSPRPPTSPFEPINIDPYCDPDYTRIPVDAPVGFTPLCAGDYDFFPNSDHQIGAPESQLFDGHYYVFDNFSNGLGQNAIYHADTAIHVADYVVATFVRGVQSRITTNPTGLKIDVDGRDNWPGQPGYGFIWGEGHTHHVNAPAQQRDEEGRMWRFVGWSDGGDREHDITVPLGSDGFLIQAVYELLGQVQVTSKPAGMTIVVNGEECTTPCTFDQEAGQTLSIDAPERVSIGEASRYEFTGWNGGGAGATRAVTFTAGAQTVTANYQASHLLLGYSEPADGAKFEFSPASPDGFFAEGTEVSVNAVPEPGYRFLLWQGDLSGKSNPSRLTVHAPATVIARLEEVPFIAPAGIQNAAGETPDGTVAPGSIISIYGDGLSEVFEIGPVNPLAQAIGNVFITVDDDNNKLLPLIFVSKTQINAQLLSGLADGEHTLQVHQIGKEDVVGSFKVSRNAPGLFYNLTPDGVPLVAALHQDGSVITMDSPARRGEIVTAYGTGFGPYNRTLIDGFIVPTDELFVLTDPALVMAELPGSEQASEDGEPVPEPAVLDPYWAGAAPGLVGAAVVQFEVTDEVPDASLVELSVNVNGVSSNKVQLPVE